MDPIRESFLQGFIRLSLWYVRNAVQAGDECLEDIVNRRVYIYRNTTFFDGKNHPSAGDVGPEWTDILTRLAEIYERRKDDPPQRFEAEGLAMLWPHLLMETVEDTKSRKRPYDCWTYDLREEGTLNLHISNVYRPRSPLSELRIPFAASLLRMVRGCRSRRPDVKDVRCSTWLNSMPRFQALFPTAWTKSMVIAPEINYTAGFWGQFIDRKGDFHLKNGELFRETGELPYPCSVCECRIDRLMSHIQKRFPKAVEFNKKRKKEQAH